MLPPLCLNTPPLTGFFMCCELTDTNYTETKLPTTRYESKNMKTFNLRFPFSLRFFLPNIRPPLRIQMTIKIVSKFREFGCLAAT